MNTVARPLAFSGLLPFVVISAMLALGVSEVPIVGPLLPVLSSYALLIVAFMAGTHWGICVTSNTPLRGPIFLLSNAIALAAWFAHLITMAPLELVIDAGALIGLLVVEHRFQQPLAVDEQYLKLRT
ncbi:MAG: DUF3429 domain-containing protein, partial [Pseudomonadota bacterium]